jgi:polyisoprenoid-binding protein YceI
MAAIRVAAIDNSPALSIDTARITIAGTTNVHDYSASTHTIRVTRAEVPATWDAALAPGGIGAFEIAVPAGSLKSPKGDLDKNMYKALKVDQFPDIAFRLTRLEPSASGVLQATGTLRITGVERQVTFDVQAIRGADALTISGQVALLMTDYGITPPKAMLGMLKTNPKVVVTFETVLSMPTD